MSATMDDAQAQLFGEFPRSVGSPQQHMVHSEGEFDVFTETVQGRRNAYSSLAVFPPGEPVVCDKVSFDLDADKGEPFEDGLRDDEKIEVMRDDPAVAEEVLGPVCDDAQKLAANLLVCEYPVMGVFSGFGIHVHALTEPTEDPAERMGSVARYWRHHLGLPTLDHKPIGDEQRIMRVPNMERVHLTDLFDPDAERYRCDLFTIPLTGDELLDITPESLLEMSRAPRPGVTVDDDERPAMPLYEDHVKESRAVTSRPDRPSIEGEIDAEGADWLVKELLRMPCMYENLLLDPEPPHDIRLNSAVLMFNAGMTPAEVVEVFAVLGWKDWDRSVTHHQLKHIYENGYSDMNCETIQMNGYCTRTEDPEACPTYGWSGGRCEWR